MRFKRAIVSALAAVSLGGAATAQVEVGGLEALDPWGLGFLTGSEAPLPADLWKASQAAALLPLMDQARTRALTPAERLLLRRVVLSPGERPEGEGADELLFARARLMYDLGEAAAAADLMAQLPESEEGGFAAEEVAADLQLALGNEASACASVLEEPRPGGFWLRLRAVCLALADNTAGAELAVELAQTEGVDDPWLWSAVFAASGELGDPPEARFDSGLHLAISEKAGLAPPTDAISASAPHLAAAMARRDTLPPDLRVQAAGIAAESGLISPDEHREAYDALFSLPEFEAGAAIELALTSGAYAEEGADLHVNYLAEALYSAQGGPARFAAVSRLLIDDIRELDANATTARPALSFARAGLAAGDLGEALRWTALAAEPPLDEEFADPLDPFEAAWVEGLALLLGGDGDTAALAAALLETSEDAGRRAAAGRLFGLWTAMEITPPAAARSFMSTLLGEPRDRVEPTALVAIEAAAQASAAGEAILQIVSLTNGDPTQLEIDDLAAMIAALRRVGAEDAARVLAAEASGYWKSAL